MADQKSNAERCRIYYARNRVTLRAAAARKRQEHPETRWEARHRERSREQTRRWRADHPAEWQAQKDRAEAARKARGYTEEQILATRARVAKWRREHPDEARELGRKWQRENPERHRELGLKWTLANPDKRRDISRKGVLTRRARVRGAFVEEVDPRVVFASAEGICGICRKPVDLAEDWHVDHIHPLSKGGEHSYANTQLAHAVCNVAKGSRHSHPLLNPTKGVIEPLPVAVPVTDR